MDLILFATPTNISFAIQGGYGELKLSNKVLDVFVKYIKGRHSEAPYIFAVALDGLEYQYYYCSQGLNNCQGGDAYIIEECERYSNGVECGLFARDRTIKWQNGINPGKGKKSKLNSKWSNEQILSKLNELGFKFKETIIKKTTSSQTSENDELLEQIKTLKELYDAGALTKEEFEKAKKTILN